MNAQKNSLLHVSKKTLFLTALVALVAMAGVSFLVPALSSSGTVSAAQEDAKREVATLDMIAYALTHKADDKAATFNYLNQLPCTEIDESNLNGKSFKAGVYCLSSATLADKMILDGQNDPSSIFIFRISGALNTKAGSSFELLGNAQASNVHFVAESATVSGTEFEGNILTKKAIDVVDGSTVKGRAVSVSGAVKAAESAVVGGGTGSLQICKATTDPAGTAPGDAGRLNDRVFQFTVTGVAGVISVPVGGCSAELNVPTGTATITELPTGTFINRAGTFTGNFQVAAVNTVRSSTGSSAITGVNLPANTATVNIVEGGTATELAVQFVNRFAITGYVEICKRPSPGPGAFNAPSATAPFGGDPDILAAGGFFTYTIQGVFQANGTTLQQFVAPVGGCTPPIAVVVGVPSPTGQPLASTVDVTELARDGFFLEDVRTGTPTLGADDLGNDGRLNVVTYNGGRDAGGTLFTNTGGGVANVDIIEGGPASETLVYFFNRSNPGQIKVCKFAGPGIPTGTVFRFNVSGPFGTTGRIDTPNDVNPRFTFGQVGPIASTAVGVNSVISIDVRAGECEFVPEAVTGTGINGLQTFAVGTPVRITEVAALIDTDAICDPAILAAGQCIPTQTLPAGNPLLAANDPNQVLFPGGPIRTSNVTFPAVTGSNVVPRFATAAETVSAGFQATPGFTSPDLIPVGAATPAATGSRISRAAIIARRSLQTVNFTNTIFRPTQLKICKVAGPGVAIGTNFTFTVALVSPLNPDGSSQFPAFSTTVTVPAGDAAQGGTCQLVEPPQASLTGLTGGAFNQGSTVTITETAVTGVSTTAITSTSSFITTNLNTRVATISGPLGLVPGVNTVTFVNSATPTPPVAPLAAFDFDGDGKSDISIYRNGTWWHGASSENGAHRATQWGLPTDKTVPADFDGDGKTDHAVYRGGWWHILKSSDHQYTGVQFGEPTDIPQAADFDGDRKADVAVFRPSTGIWYVLGSKNGFSAMQWGEATDKPVAADYDGDGKADIAVYRPSNGTWYMQKSAEGFAAQQWGMATDKPVVADYDGDRKADPAVYRAGTWYLLKSSEGFASIQLGNSTDTPVVADYNGDGKADAAVYRSGVWYMVRSGEASSIQFGEATDLPVPASFVR